MAPPLVEFETDYATKLFFPNPAFNQVYFEAVANAIDANADRIRIETRMAGNAQSPEIEVSITDNGAGLSNERYERFKKVKKPKDPSHKGLGRLIYLRYFKEVAVTSVFPGSRRTFTFIQDFNGKSSVTPVDAKEPVGTKLVFRHFQRERIRSYDDLKPGVLRRQLLEQFLPMLYERKRAGRPVTIEIELVADSNPQRGFYPDTQKLDENDLPEFKMSTIEDETLDWFEKVDVHYFVKTGQPERLFITAAVVDNRTIPLKLLPDNAVPADTSVLFLFESNLFRGSTDSARQHLILPEGTPEITFNRILKREIGHILAEELPYIKERNVGVKEEVENSFPHLIGLFDTETVGLIDREEAISIAQQRFFQKQREVLGSDPNDEKKFEASLEVSARSLMEYVLYRELVIRMLQNTSPEDSEDTIHDLLVPRYDRFDESNFVEGIYRNNAWVLDDKFMTFRTILSEMTMKKLISEIALAGECADDGRPDISMIFSADPEKESHVDVVVVELKRKTDNDKDNMYAITQLLKRARKLVDFCPNIQRVWYYGIIEIDRELDRVLRDQEWIPIHSKGKMLYKEHRLERENDGVIVPAPFFLVSFDAITADAAARNHAFLELLKSKFKRQAQSPAESSSFAAE